MLPPIGEEMNKSRRMFSLQAQHLAKHGVISVIPDLYGLGDSEGATALTQWMQEIAEVERTTNRWEATRAYAVARRNRFLLGKATTPMGTPEVLLVLEKARVKGASLLEEDDEGAAKATGRARRGVCFNCGKRHLLKDCPAPCTVECPRHGSLFDLRTGKPKTLPAFQPVRTFPVEIIDENITLEV